MDFICTFKIKIESKMWNMGVSRTIDKIKIKIRMQNPSQEPSASSKAPYQDLGDIDVLFFSKIKI